MLLPIEMRDEAKVVLESVPLDGHIFNVLMQRRNEARPSSHGNYIPALEAAERLLNKFSHGGCALNLLFLSDGRPSDARHASPLIPPPPAPPRPPPPVSRPLSRGLPGYPRPSAMRSHRAQACQARSDTGHPRAAMFAAGQEFRFKPLTKGLSCECRR